MPTKSFLRCIFGTLLCFFTMGILFAQQIPEVEVQTLDGNAQTLKSDQARVIYFFDASLRKRDPMLKMLNKLHYAFAKSRLQVMAVYADLEPAEREEMEELKATIATIMRDCAYPCYYDIGRNALTKFGVVKAPVLYIADAEGTVVYSTKDSAWEYHVLKIQVEYALGYIDQTQRDVGMMPKEYYMPEVLDLQSETKPYLPEALVHGETENTENAENAENTENTENETNENKEHLTHKEEVKETAEHTTKEENAATIAKETEKVVEKAIETKMDEKSLAAVVIGTGPIGYTWQNWYQADSADKAIFYIFLDMVLGLLPLIIWGWGMLYCLSKVKLYRNMLYGFIACFGFFLYEMWNISCRIPFELCIISPELWKWKEIAIAAKYYLAGKTAWSLSQVVSHWHAELLIVLLLQCAFIRGIAGRLKTEEQESEMVA